MMVPRSFKYAGTASSVSPDFDGKERQRKNCYNSITSSRVPPTVQVTPPQLATKYTSRPEIAPRAVTAPMETPTKPMDVPRKKRSVPKSSTQDARKASSQHRADAVSPSVAALLAMTAIPPPRPHQVRRRRTTGTAAMSIDELVSQWKNDDTLRPSASSSPTMSILLESVSDQDAEESSTERSLSRTRSPSTDSVPSLEADERSLFSVYAPSTPGSSYSRKSMWSVKRERKSSSLVEDSLLDHPLLPAAQIDVEDLRDFSVSFTQNRKATPKARSSLRSNLTTSLQALKNAAISSISSLTASSSSAPFSRSGANSSSNLSDDVLWSHPFLFPRLSSEVRPAISGTPSKAQRRYLNPMPLTFEEQEEPFQKALHAPFLAEKVASAPIIQLQTYSRARRRSVRKASSDPQSEAGRAQILSSDIRQREARENGDFLRVIVLEMNMRRAGKLEVGRAKMWLPPRQDCERDEVPVGKIPPRWVPICAEYS